MGKIIAAINMTLDGVCDHNIGIADDELHQHYTNLLKNSDAILFGRKTYQLMEYWKSVLENPTGNKSFDEFAVVIDRITKVVFSTTLQNLDWSSATLSDKSLADKSSELEQQLKGEILACSPSIISQLTNLNLVDEFQICIHPFIAGEGLQLFNNITDIKNLQLQQTKTLQSGATIMYYQLKQE